MNQEKCKKTNFKFKMPTSNAKGITLIALIITIIVMLILVAVTISVALNGGLIGKAQEAKTKTQYEEDKESLFSAVIGALNNNTEVDFEKLDKNLPNGFTGEKGNYTSKAGNNFTVDKNGGITTPKPLEVNVTVGGQPVTLTKENLGRYLGKIVTNYKADYNTTETANRAKVSTKYRLYYIDFDGKYGKTLEDGTKEKGTIFLKADCTIDKIILTKDSTSVDDPNVKVKELNPGLYNAKDDSGAQVNPPSARSDNMESVIWLLNSTNWESLKPNNTADGMIKYKDINYVVGAPSLELMVDSYNTHYASLGYFNLNEEIPDTTTTLEETENRVKLFYKYPYVEGTDSNSGYGVGPLNNSINVSGFDRTTSYYSVKLDDSVGGLYFPENASRYWLASPAPARPGHGEIEVYRVNSIGGGMIDNAWYRETSSKSYGALAPVVSLLPSTLLMLEN